MRLLSYEYWDDEETCPVYPLHSGGAQTESDENA